MNTAGRRKKRFSEEVRINEQKKDTAARQKREAVSKSPFCSSTKFAVPNKALFHVYFTLVL